MQTGNTVRLLTVGHSNHELPQFVKLLQRAGVTAVADVRSRSFSRRLPQFNRPRLVQALKDNGIAYVFLGNLLGGRPESMELYDGEGRVDYERVRATTPFQRGIERLIGAVDRYTVAVLCAEADPLDCHRGLMIAPALTERGVSLGHLRKDGTTESQAEFENRLLAETGTDAGMVDGLFANLITDGERRELLAEAYRRRARRAAFQKKASEDGHEPADS